MRHIISLLLCIVTINTTFAQSHYQYYYVAIGSGDYLSSVPGDPTFVIYPDVSAAAASANAMKMLLEKCLKAKGVCVVSNEDNMITKEKVLGALAKVEDMIKADKATQPFVIFYYCGHGKSENMAGSEYLIPGDCNMPNNPTIDIRQSHLKKGEKMKIISLGEITENFKEKKLDYMVLADCCRDEASRQKVGVQVDKAMYKMFDSMARAKGLSADMISAAHEGFADDWADAKKDLTEFNQYKQANAVVFAANPNTEAAIVPQPLVTTIHLPAGEDNTMGPICRRTLLAFDAFYRSDKKQYTVQDFVKQLTDAGFDKSYPKSVSGYQDNPEHARQVVLLAR